MFRQLWVIMFLGLALSLPVQAAEDVFGPIKRTDTLWNIAEQLNPDKSASIQQVMLAIYQKNQHAFTVNNINSLRKDAYMLSPTVAEVNALSRKSAIRMVQRHNTRWKKGRYVAIHTAVPDELLKKLAESSTAEATSSTAQQVDTTAPAATGTTTSGSAEGSAPAALAVPETIVDGMPLKDQLRIVLQELNKARQENQLLQTELKQVRARQQQNQSDPDIQAQLDALRRELAELRTILAQKDNHIQTLQASLKSASAAIKSQHADNMRLYNKLKELSPESIPAQAQQPADKPKIALAAVTEDALLADAEGNVSSEQSTGKVWADEQQSGNENTTHPEMTASGQHEPADTAETVSLSQLVSNNTGLAQSGTTESHPRNGTYKVSPVAWAALLLSFVFILFLVIRALIVQNQVRKFIDDE